MNPNLQSILEDLYSLEPELKKSEKDLIPLLEKLVESKPDLKLDEQFVANLRNQIIMRADTLMETKNLAQPNWFHRFLAPLMGGTVALAALVIGLMVWRDQPGLVIEPDLIQNKTSVGMDNAWPPATPIPTPMAEVELNAENTNQKTAVPEASETAPMMLQAVPMEEGAETATSESDAAPMATLRKMDAGIQADQTDRDSTIKLAFERVQAGELKIEAGATGKKSLLPGDITNVDLNNLPEGYVEIKEVLPEGIRVIEDQTPTWVDGLPQYYLYFEKEQQWYGPF